MSEAVTNKPSMQEICDEEGYVEEWEVIVNKTKYPLNPYQTALLKQEIARGNRGVVMFKEFAISIPFIEEFYLLKRYQPGQKQLSMLNIPDREMTEEEREKAGKKLAQIREDLIKKGILPRKSPEIVL